MQGGNGLTASSESWPLFSQESVADDGRCHIAATKLIQLCRHLRGLDEPEKNATKRSQLQLSKDWKPLRATPSLRASTASGCYAPATRTRVK